MAVNGVVPMVPPWLVASLAFLIFGIFLALLALMRRNLRLVVNHGLDPFNPADWLRAGSPALPTLRPGEKPFASSFYGQVSLCCIALGATGTVIIVVWLLFAG